MPMLARSTPEPLTQRRDRGWRRAAVRYCRRRPIQACATGELGEHVHPCDFDDS